LAALVLLLTSPLAVGQDDKDSWIEDPGQPGCWRESSTGATYGCGDGSSKSDDDKGDDWKVDEGKGDDGKGNDGKDQSAPDPMAPSLPPNAPRHKILCFHGGGSDGESLRMGLRSLELREPWLEFVFPNAPYAGGLWMKDPPGGKSNPTMDADWDALSLQQLDDLVATQGPFYALYGFSQGGAYVLAYLAHAPTGTFQKVVIFCGYPPTTHLGILGRIEAARPLHTPAFVWMGEKDGIISNAQTQAAASYFEAATVSRSSSGGHDPLPAVSDPAFDALRAFLALPSPPPPVPRGGDLVLVEAGGALTVAHGAVLNVG